MLEEILKGFKLSKYFIAYGPQLTKIVRFSLANPLRFLGNVAANAIPNPIHEPQPKPLRDEGPNLDILNIDLYGLGVTDYLHDISIGYAASECRGNQKAGEGPSRPQGATIPVVTQEVEREVRVEQ